MVFYSQKVNPYRIAHQIYDQFSKQESLNIIPFWARIKTQFKSNEQFETVANAVLHLQTIKQGSGHATRHNDTPHPTTWLKWPTGTWEMMGATPT